jgi:hypothetical protein
MPVVHHCSRTHKVLTGISDFPVALKIADEKLELTTRGLPKASVRIVIDPTSTLARFPRIPLQFFNYIISGGYYLFR